MGSSPVAVMQNKFMYIYVYKDQQAQCPYNFIVLFELAFVRLREQWAILVLSKHFGAVGSKMFKGNSNNTISLNWLCSKITTKALSDVCIVPFEHIWNGNGPKKTCGKLPLKNLKRQSF